MTPIVIVGLVGLGLAVAVPAYLALIRWSVRYLDRVDPDRHRPRSG